MCTCLAVAAALLAVTLPVLRTLGQWRVWQEQLRGLSCVVSQLDGQALREQRNLAKWYNLDPGNREAYPQILNLWHGVMGYLALDGRKLPIFHGIDSPVGHDPDSALPLGGRGNHTVLYVQVQMQLYPGDPVYIGCLGEVLAYEVLSVQVMPGYWSTQWHQNGTEDLLTLVWDRDGKRTLVRCKRLEAVPELPEDTAPALALQAAALPLVLTAVGQVFRRYPEIFWIILGKKGRKTDSNGNNSCKTAAFDV